MNDLREKPFAFIGVNIGRHEPPELKAVMAKEKLNWRSFADGASIARRWNSLATPSYFILDHTGTIRHRWVGNPGEKRIEAALSTLIRAAQTQR